MTLQQYAEQLDRITSDVRLEVILAELSHDGLDPRRDLMLHSAGLFSRSYRHDVGRAVVGNTDAFGDDALSIDPARRRYLNVEVHRDGIYDYLPEGLFHQPTNLGRDQGEIFEDIDEQARRQRGIRQFFQPIEQEFYLQGLSMELEERKYFVTEQNLQQNDQGDVLRRFWGLPANLLDIRQLNNMLHLLPIANRLVHNTPLVTQVFELMLTVPIEIRTIAPLIHLIELAPGDVASPNDLSRAELGNFALEGLYQDTMPAYEIRIGPLSADQLPDYLANGRGRAIMNLLICYFMPSEVDIVDHLLVNPDEQFLQFADTDDAPSSVLGVASYI